MVRVSKNGNEIILYLIFSILITLVNIIGYIICTRSLSLDVYNSNVIAWLLAILFAYLTNRTFVFHSKAKTFKDKLIEAVNFFGSRLFLFVV
ncbi:MAG: GtrA family protein, partial [Bacilli bacterium]|nr:GtrA family protein [Bacilli bacterium]